MSSIASDLDYGSVNAHEDHAQAMRRRLKYYFMNPCEKYRAKKKIPWKLILQVLKIFLVTIQIVVFGYERSAHVEFLDRTNIAFEHLYLRGWDATFETMPYPPATGHFAVYTIPEFYESVDYLLRKLHKTGEIAIGTYHPVQRLHNETLVHFCKKHYVDVRSFRNSSYHVDDHEKTECVEILLNATDNKYNSKVILQDRNFSMNFDRILQVTVNFTLQNLHIKSNSNSKPSCYEFDIKVIFHNEDHDGQMLVKLKSTPYPTQCQGSFNTEVSDARTASMVVLNMIIILISVISLFLCVRSIFRAQKLRKMATEFFLIQYGQQLTMEDKMEFLNGWYIMIIINDILVAVGSLLMTPILLSLSENYEVCGVFLGTANLLVWLGVLRYLTFFDTYNILLLTIRRAMPHMMRFLLCAIIFYVGFLICGWVILGPYHIKFRYLSTASECLFSLINGDDMFVTFQAIPYSASYIWVYSRVYLYSFISLFIYVVLSLFISIIIDVYETIKDYYQHGFPKSTIQKFVEFVSEEDARFPSTERESPCRDNCLLGPCYAFCCKRAYEPECEEHQRLVHHSSSAHA